MKRDFHSLYTHGFVRVAAATPQAHVGDPAANAAEILELARRADAAKAAICVFPELSLSAYAIDDLLHQEALLDAVEAELARLVEPRQRSSRCWWSARRCGMAGRLYNCAVVIHRGACWASCRRAYLPNYREFYEKRHFAPGAGVRGETIAVGGREVAVRHRPALPLDRQRRRRRLPCRDLRGHLGADPAVEPRRRWPGAEILLNLSASNITIGKADERRLLCASQSARAHRRLRSTPPPGRRSPPPTSPGTARRRSSRTACSLAESERFAAEPR